MYIVGIVDKKLKLFDYDININCIKRYLLILL